MTRYLRQAKSNYVTVWHPVAAERKDQMEISEAEALELLKEQTKTKQQRMKEGSWVGPSPEPAVEVPTVVEKEEAKVDMTEDKGDAQLADDQSKVPPTGKPDYGDEHLNKLEEIRVVGKGKAQIEAYMKEHHGIDVDRRLRLDELVNQAVAARQAVLDKESGKEPEAGIPVE